MAGQRQTRLISLLLSPGYYVNATLRSESGRYIDGNRVRFNYGLPEKIGGWQRIPLTSLDENATYVVLSGTNSGTENDLSWIASTGAFPIAGYKLYNADDDTLIIDTTSTSYADTGLSAGTYNYYVVSYDTQGTESYRSNVLSIEITSSPVSVSFTVTVGGPNSTGPLEGSGDGTGFWTLACNGISSVGTITPSPASLGGHTIIACGWSGQAGGYFVLMLEAVLDATFLTSITIDAPANLTFNQADATFYVDSSDHSVWYWPDSHEYTYLGQTLNFTVNGVS